VRAVGLASVALSDAVFGRPAVLGEEVLPRTPLRGDADVDGDAVEADAALGDALCAGG
jgi:hypothetical protein